MSRFPRTAALAALVALAACGGGSSAVPPAGTSGSGVATPFAVTVAAASNVTKIGIASSAEAGSPEHDIDVSAGSAACVRGGTTRTCTASFTLPAGQQTLTVSAYGAAVVRSTLRTSLSGARVALAVGTAIAQISLDLASAQLAGGTGGTTTLYVTARDANGNTIVGSFSGAAITVSSTDTTGSVTLSPTTITAGGTAVAVTYNGSGSVTSVTFNATSTGVAASAIVAATLTFTASQLVYVADGTNVVSFPSGGNGDLPPISTFSVTNAPTIYRAAPDGAGNMWLAVPNPGASVGGSWNIGSVPAGSTGATAITFLPQSAYPSGQVPWDFGVDATGNLYLYTLDGAGDSAITVYPPNSTTASRAISGSNTMLTTNFTESNPLFSVASNGTIAIASIGSGSSQFPSTIIVFPPNASGNVAPSQVIAGSATLPSSAFVFEDAVSAADGSIVALALNYSTGAAAVEVFAPGATGNVAPVRTIAGGATGLAVTSNGLGSNTVHVFGVVGIGSVAVDSGGRIYVSETGSQSIVSGQIEEFAAGATGNVAPAAVIGGPLTLLTAPFGLQISGGVVPPAYASTSPSVTGNFLAPAPNRGWNYTMTEPEVSGSSPTPPTTLSLYADPNPVNGATELVALTVPGANPATAIGAPGAVIAGEALFSQGTDGGWVSPGYFPVSNGVALGGFIPIPGNIRLVSGTLTQGQSINVYPFGLTGAVTSVGAVPGASACPGGATTGAIVAYTFGVSTETVGYVPGCGITYFVSDNGTTATLTSVGTYASAGELSHERSPASVDTIQTLRALWRGVFTPWRAK